MRAFTRLFNGLHPGHGKLTWFRVIQQLPKFRSIQARFHYGFGTKCLNLKAVVKYSPAHSSIGTTSYAKGALCLIVSRWFQVLFHGVFNPSFHLSLTVLVHYRSYLVFSLGVWSPQIQKGVCRLLTYSGTLYRRICFRLQDFHLLWSPIPRCSANKYVSNIEVLQPQNKFWFGLFPVRSSLTKGISYDFFSSAYLDISVRRVTHLKQSLRAPMISHGEITLFGHRRIITFTQLPVDFRGVSVLLRPDKPRHPLSALIYICFSYYSFDNTEHVCNITAAHRSFIFI